MKRIILFCAIIIGVAGLANAAPTITFNGFPLGTMVSNQFAGLGVEFLPGPLTGELPQISMNWAKPTRPILRPTGKPDYYTYQRDFWMKFTSPVVDVAFDPGYCYWDAVGSAVIHVYDPGKSFFGSLSNKGTGVQVINISGMSPVGYIYFNSIGDGDCANVDNLDFTQIPTPGAILLSSIGLGVVGWLRRQRTL